MPKEWSGEELRTMRKIIDQCIAKGFHRIPREILREKFPDRSANSVAAKYRNDKARVMFFQKGKINNI